MSSTVCVFVIEQFTLLTPFLRFFHRFLSVFASILLNFDYFPFFLGVRSIIFVFVFVFCRFLTLLLDGPFFVFLSFVGGICSEI